MSSGRQAAAEDIRNAIGPRASNGMNVLDPSTRAQSPDGAESPVLRLRKEANTSGVIPVSNNIPAPTPVPITPEAQVRIVAMVGNLPIYESEVREAINQRLSEVVNLNGPERAAREKKIFQEELKRIVERELILDDMFSKLKKAKPALIEMINEDASKDADKRLRNFRSSRGIGSDEEFKVILEAQGLTLPGMRRQIERNFMMGQYVSNLIGPKAQRVNLSDLQDYYHEHQEEFRTDDKVKWQDIFLRYDKFRSVDEARSFAQQLVARARNGDDFAALAKEYDQGDSSLRGGFGFGEKRGEVQPVAAEAILFALKPGEVGQLIELDSGIHIVKLVERAYAGIKPFNIATQNEIRKKVATAIGDREIRKVLDDLKRKTPVVYAEKSGN